MQDEPPFTIKKPFPEIMLVERKKKHVITSHVSWRTA